MSNANTASEGQAMTAQKRANLAALRDGERCRRKGFGLTKSGRHDHAAWQRLFRAGYKKSFAWVDELEAYEEWVYGWHAEDERLEALKSGHYVCGRPV